MSALSIFTSDPIEGILSPCISSGRRAGARSGRRSIPGMASLAWATRRTRPLLTSKKSGRPEASRQICIRVRPGKGASNLRNQRLRSLPPPRSLLPRQQRVLRLQVHQHLSLRLRLIELLLPQGQKVNRTLLQLKPISLPPHRTQLPSRQLLPLLQMANRPPHPFPHHNRQDSRVSPQPANTPFSFQSRGEGE